MTYNSTIKAKLKICIDCGENKFIFARKRCKVCDAIWKRDNPKKKDGFAIKESKRLVRKANRIKRSSNTKRSYSIKLDEWFTSKQIVAKVEAAKRLKKEIFMSDHGYAHCQECKTNQSIKFDASHVISVKDCKERAEIDLSLAWDLDNIKILCRECHQQHDKLYLGFFVK